MSDLRILDLRCEYLVAPLGIDEIAPRLSWRLDSDRRGARQLAYRVRVASSAEKLAAGESDRWDSGRVESAQTTHVAYAGAPLRSREECHWSVEVWGCFADATSDRSDGSDRSVRSAASLWTMGLLAPTDWSARWVTHNLTVINRDGAAVHGDEIEPGTPILFRREFALPAAVRRATVYASARGVFELRANGRRVGDDLFAPEWTDYDKRIHYRTYDVTAPLAAGANCLAATLGDGWWTGYVGWQEQRGRYDSFENSLLVQLEVECADGSRHTFGTDRTWGTNTGPILSSDFMMGERYDARRERAGWDSPFPVALRVSAGTDPDAHAPGYANFPWLPAVEVAAPKAPLVAQRSEPVRITESIEPVSVDRRAPNVTIFNLGQNISGWVQLRLHHVPAGTQVVVRHGERLSPDGSLYTENLRRAKATELYISCGTTPVALRVSAGTSDPSAHTEGHDEPTDSRSPARERRDDRAAQAAGHVGGEQAGVETYEPHFTFHGFQYVEVSITPPAAGALPHSLTPSLPSVTVLGRVIHSATPPAGKFECSHAGVNRLWLNGVWSQRDNFLSVPTDCPQRDERLGWMGDAQVFLRTATCNMDVAAFFTKWMIDVEDAQTPEGVFPDVAPRLREDVRFVGLGNLGGAAAWADAGVIIPHTLWRVYGDRRILERHYGAMTKWVDWIDRYNPAGLRLNQLANNYGDWLCIPSDTSFGTHSPMKNLLATAYWADDARKLTQIARELGHAADAARFQTMFEKVRAAFQKEWLLPDGQLAVETQTAYLLALAFDLLPENVRTRAAERLVDDIRGLNWHLSTGFVGISHLNPQLTLAGHADVAYRLLLQDTYPSWLYPVNHGATTIWERWNGWTEKDGFFVPHMNSFNHYSLGSVGEWLFRHVAGIEADPEKPGFQHFILQPHLGAGLDWAGATYRTMHGEIESRWRREGEKLTWTVRIPANTSALIFIPSDPDTAVDSGGLPVLRREGSFAVCEASAGRYEFRSVRK